MPNPGLRYMKARHNKFKEINKYMGGGMGSGGIFSSPSRGITEIRGCQIEDNHAKYRVKLKIK